MASKKLLMLLLLFCVMAAAESAFTAYPTWELSKSIPTIYISVGDSVKFIYQSGHSVFAFKYFQDYDNCNLNAAYDKLYSGGDLITFLYAGTYYYTCGVYDHCKYGMKLIVIVR